jgi:hypothetical protein
MMGRREMHPNIIGIFSADTINSQRIYLGMPAKTATKFDKFRS